MALVKIKQIDGLGAKHTELDASIDSLESVVTVGTGDLEASVNSLEGVASAAINSINSLETRVSTADSDIAVLEGDVLSIDTRLSTVESEAASLETRVDAAANEVVGYYEQPGVATAANTNYALPALTGLASDASVYGVFVNGVAIDQSVSGQNGYSVASGVVTLRLPYAMDANDKIYVYFATNA